MSGGFCGANGGGATGIIGDNVDTVVEQAARKTNARLLPIHCEGFAGEYRSGFDLVFGELVKLMDAPTAESKAALSLQKILNLILILTLTY